MHQTAQPTLEESQAGGAGDWSEEVYTFPLSFAQQGLWLLSQLQRENPAYHIPNACLLRGPLRVDLLARSLDAIVARHEALRTSFAVLDGEPVQVVAPERRCALRGVDLSGLAPAAAEAEMRRAARDEVRRPFDLARGPLIRFALVRVAPERHLLLSTAHHLVFDGWSERVFLGELVALYGGFAAGEEARLPELEIQYGDYAHWERESLQGEELERLVAYWRTRLAGAPDALELPTDRPRPAEPGHEGAHLGVAAPADVTERLAGLAREEGATLFAPLLAAYAVLLHRLSGQDDVLVGSPAANRDQVELEGLVGFFVNALVLRLDLSGDPTFRELVARAREVVYGAQEHGALPFGKLVSELHPRRDLSRNPFFQVMFNLDAASAGEGGDAGGLAVEPFPVGSRTVQFDLVLSLADTGAGLRGTLGYATELFDAATAARALEHFTRVLHEAASDPERRVSDLLLPAAERERVLREWNRTERDYPRDVCLHELVDAQVRRTPDAVAVVFEGESLTYAELSARADGIAARLAELGVGPETVVAVRMERSPGLVAALLGVLRAGGAYLPVDPAYPEQRQRFMLEDSGARVLLTTAALLAAHPAPAGVAVVCPDDEPLRAPEGSAPRPGVTADGLAYVIFTSGSTGRPKGAMNSHRAIVNRILWMQEAYGLDASDAVLQKTPYSFDVSVWEFFWPLVAGARLVLARPDGHRDPGYLRDLVAEAGITTLHFVPSMLAAFLELERLERCGGLRRVVCSGEALSADLQARFFSRLPGVALHNLYGPTEAAVDVTHWSCLPGADDPVVPIGRPVANTRIYLLDGRLAPVPQGMPGELYIGGVQVGRGYHGRPGLTAERFVPDACSGEPGARLYRTGDLARHRPDGVIDFLGRIDQQVKVRGFRIELGEIEAALREHPGVREAAVTARRDRSGTDRLVAYVVPGDAEAPTPASLRAHLRASLPEHMVPGVFATLETLPLTPSGKRDRGALPEPGPERAGVEEDFVAPRDVVEDTLASIWSRVLGVEMVGVHDNFYALGGDSILSLRVASLARERGLPVSVRQVALNPTVAGLAASIRAEGATGEGEVRTAPFDLVSPEDRARLPEGVVDAYPLARIQLGMLYHRERTPESAVYHGITSFQVRMPLDEAALQRAVLHVTARHPNLRTAFDLESYTEPLQLVYGEAVFPVGFHDLRHLADDEQEAAVARFIREEQERPFDLARAPQIRFDIHRRTDDSFQFTLVENHAVSDGWSLHTVLAEILASYLSLLAGEGLPEFPPLETTYRDFIHLERRTLESEEARRFWKERLEAYQPTPLPRVLPAGYQEEKRLRRVVRRLPKPLVAGLRRVAQQESVPFKSVLLAAHLRVLAFLAGRDDVVTGLSSNGRLETADGDRVAGLFLNTLPFRVELPEGSWSELVRAVHRAELEAMPYRRYPLAAIQADLGGKTLFDASFVYLNFHVVADTVRAGGVKFEGKPVVLEETNFALMTTFQHRAGDARRIGLVVETDGWRLSEGQTEEIAGYYLRVLQAIADDPSGRCDAFSPLAGDERRRILEEWSVRADAAPLEHPVHRVFEEHAARDPGAPCVEWAGGILSRGEVDRRAGRLARRLRALGVGPEARVALCMDRVPEIVPAVLGVLRAGGAYVPVDPAAPAGRVRWILEDCGAAAVLTLERWRPLLEGAGIPVLSLDGAPDDSADHGDVELPAATDPASLAYVVYTSGTTGRPKGVQVEHRQLMHYTGAALARLDAPREGRYALVSTFAADLGNTALFPALCAGGTLRVLSEPEATDPAVLAAALGDAPVDFLKVVPSHLRALLAHDDAASLLPRRTLVLGGDRSDWALAERVRELAPGCAVFNHYGPTETTVGVLAGALDPGEPGRPDAPPLGRPLAHARVHVLDAALQPVPAGVAGELFVGGPAVSRGYLGRPDLTAERFVPDPFAPEPGGRLYRTGDRARFLTDGRVEFLGRTDHQVKVRGYRVELREVEEAIRSHPEVADAAALVREEEGEGRLVGYVVAAGGRRLPADALRRFLEERVPAYMVPTHLVELSALPLTSNGKLDRAALPAPGSATDAGSSHVAPRSELEEELARLWSEVIRVDRVGVYDEFYQLGGDSIKAILLTARVRRAFGISLPVETLLAAGTVAALAGTIEIAMQGAGAAAEDPVVPVPRDGELPLSFGQQRLWYTTLLDPDSPAHNLPYTLRLQGPLDVDAWRRALAEVVRRHEVLRTRFPMVDGEPRPEAVAELRPEVPLVDLGDVPEGERDAALRVAAEREAWRPFDLERGPLLRAALVRVGEEDHGFVLAFHHVVFDGWSAGVLTRELVALYGSFVRGEPSPLPELPIQYADFAAWQRRRLEEMVLERQLAYWRGRLEGARPLELPTDHPRPAVQTSRGDAVALALTPELTEALRVLSRSEGVSPFMTFLAAYAVLLRHRSGQDDLVVGCPVAVHRDRPELNELIGLFLNTLPLRVELDGDPSFRDLLVRVRRTALEGFANQDVPYEKVVEALRTRREEGRGPLFRVWFNHSNVPRVRPAFEGLTVAPLDVGDPAVKFDLRLSTEEANGRMVAVLGYNRDLFERESSRGMLADLHRILERAAERPQRPVSELLPAPEAEEPRGGEAAARAESLRLRLQIAGRRAVTLET